MRDNLIPDLSFLPAPDKVIISKNLKIIAWGWFGFDLNEKIIENTNHSIDNLTEYFINNAEGVYFAILIDNQSNACYFFSDRYSCKKIFLAKYGDKFYLTDFLFKLKSLDGFRLKLDELSLALYLMFGFIPANKTLLQEVCSLKPFTVYKLSNNQLTERLYYKINFTEQDISYTEATGKIFRLFEERLYERIKYFDKFIVPLSGGRDSRFILGILLKHTEKKDITTFTFGQPGTYDYEIGKYIAKKYGLKNIYLKFNAKTYYSDYVIRHTKYKNGLINHVVDAPSKLYEYLLGSDKSPLIVSGYIGDAVLAWAHEKKFISAGSNRLIPKPVYFSYDFITGNLFPDLKEELDLCINEMVEQLFDDINQLVPEKWFYCNHVPFYTNICLFSEEINFSYSLPFIERFFFDFVRTVPVAYKKKTEFYRDIISHDNLVKRIFSLPLKTLRSKGYNNSFFKNLFYQLHFNLRSVKNYGHPMKNYINFNAAYPDSFLNNEITELKKYNQVFYKLLDDNMNKLNFRKKTLLLSLKLYYKEFFGV